MLHPISGSAYFGYYSSSFAPSARAMQLFIDYIPIIFFVAAYFYEDIYFATAVLMAVMPLVVIIQWLITRKVSKIYLASTLLVLVAGTITLVYRNPTFIYWKPTVLNWVLAAIFLGSQWIGEKSIVRRMMESAADLTDKQWFQLNLMWVGFFVVIGIVNIYVAYGFGEEFWVKFKLPGMLGLTVLFVVAQSVWLAMVMKGKDTETSEPEV